MSTNLNLKEMERKAFRSTYQDGLWDLYIGLIVIFLAVFMFRPKEGYSVLNIVLAVSGFALAYLVFWAGKKFITLPRLGQVTFGPKRRQRRLTLAIILGAVVMVQAGFISLSVFGWLNPDVAEKINSLLKSRDLMDLMVAAVGSLFVGPSMILIAYFIDFPRGYYIAVMMSLAVFLMILLNRPLYPIIIGGMIALPGLVLFVRFLRKYPLRRAVAHVE